MKHLTIVVLMLLSGAGMTTGEEIDITNEELAKLAARGVPIVDVRTPPEWRTTGVVSGSHLLTFFDAKGKSDPATWLVELKKFADPNDPLVLICRTGNRTSKIAAYLDTEAGYKKVYNVQRGIKNWIAAGLPVEKVLSGKQ